MGVYMYTLRTETKKLGVGGGRVGELVGRAAYSYKECYSFHVPKGYKRSVSAKHSHAERASRKLVGKVKLMVYGDKFESGMDVYDVGEQLPVLFVSDAGWPGKIIGKLEKIGVKWCVREK